MFNWLFGKKLKAGDRVTVFDRYRLSFPVTGTVIFLLGDVVEVKLDSIADPRYSEATVWVFRQQLEILK